MRNILLLLTISFVLGCSTIAISSDLSGKVSRAITQQAKLDKHELDIISWQSGVTINGFVSSQAEKDQIERIARSVDGVDSVDNRLEVRSPTGVSSASSHDRALVAAVSAALQQHARDADHNVSVVALNGRVKLEGQVGSANDHSEIVRLVRGVEGVQEVVDNLSLRPAQPDSEIDHSVRQALLQAEGIDMTGLSIGTKDGIVTVHGAVKNHRDIDRVLGVILMVRGVRDARSDVRIGNAG